MAYTPEQRNIIDLGLRLSAGYPERVRRALLEAMAVESNFRNLGYGDRDSEGPLQQRPSTGWGPASETAATDIQQFLARASQVNKGFRGTAGQLAQAVQRSAFPERYDQRKAEVLAILAGSPSVGGGGHAGAPAGAGALRGPGAASLGAVSPVALSVLASNNEIIGVPTPALELAQGQPPTARAPKPGSPGPARVRPPKPGQSTLNWLRNFASPYGLTVTSTTGGKHVPGSYHYKARAVDLAGTPSEMLAVAREALRNPGRFREMFYDPLGFYIKNGKVYRGAIGGHSDHVHLAR